MKIVDQSTIKTLIRERFEHPGLYADRPLVVWQADWHDGIQQELVMDVMRQDRSRPKEERRYFRANALRRGKDYSDTLNAPRQGLTVGYVAYPNEQLSLAECLSEVKRVHDANESNSPLIIYLPYRHQLSEHPKSLEIAEQCLFAPDFEQWAASWQDTLIPDFIRGDGDKAGITYRWYNRFNAPDLGCSTPRTWSAANFTLNLTAKLRGFKNKLCGIGALDDDVIRSVFRHVGGISDDVVDSFLIYMKSPLPPTSGQSEDKTNRDK